MVHSSWEVLLVVPAAGGAATWSTPGPLTPALAGGTLYAQALVPDTVNRFGWVLSNSVCVAIGEK